MDLNVTSTLVTNWGRAGETMEGRFIPQPSPVSKPYWEKASQEELWIQKCEDCSAHTFYPRVACPHCWGENLKWVKASGKGKIYTYTVVHRTDLDAFADKVPYIYAIVELEEGPRMSANIINCPVDEVHTGMPVQVVFEELGSDMKLPQFEPRSS